MVTWLAHAPEEDEVRPYGTSPDSFSFFLRFYSNATALVKPMRVEGVMR
jgi:hypothetical protein